ncbi:DNA polymerase subunit beta [Candidatus Bathyarchaeota archaeon]|nr:DNA polymerase subunit beta [Candidatus Bathyarchaeota archaeon]
MMRIVASEVVYSERHWEILGEQRARAASIMRPLHDSHIHCTVYGSMARGDTSESSDIDVFIPTPPSPTMIEAILESSGIRYQERQIIQATPSYAAKGYIIIDDMHGYSFPLVDMRPNEAEFTRFAGQVSLTDLENKLRVPGINKELRLIEPTNVGHNETAVQGIEGIVARKLGVDIRIVNERVRALKRREKVGRTGVFIKRDLSPDETFSSVFQELVRSKPALRRRIRNR